MLKLGLGKRRARITAVAGQADAPYLFEDEDDYEDEEDR